MASIVKKVWAACYRVTGCAADADEVLQEAFARAIETKPEVSDLKNHSSLGS